MSTAKLPSRALFVRPAKIAGIIGGVGGFVGDVLTPLGPVVTYFAYCSAAVLVVALLALVVVKGSRKEGVKAVAVTAGLSMVVFGAFGQINAKAQNGWLADHFDSFAQLQQVLHLLDARIDVITEEIHEVGAAQTAQINELMTQTATLKSGVDSLLSMNVELVQALAANKEQSDSLSPRKLRQLRRWADREEGQDGYSSILQFFNARFKSWEAHRSNGADFLRACDSAASEFPHTELGYYCKALLAARNRNYSMLASSLDTCKQVFEDCAFCCGLLEDVNDNTKALEQFPNSPVLLYKRALAYQSSRNHKEALNDLKEVWKMTRDLEVLTAALQQVWALKKWSEIEGLFGGVEPQDVEESLKVSGSGQFSNLNFLIPPSGGVDLSFLKSDLVAEQGRVYVGHFLRTTSPAAVPSGVVERTDSAAFKAWFAAPARPVLDGRDCRLEVLPMHFARDRWAVQIAKLRQSPPGSLFTIVFRVQDESTPAGEVLVLEEGIRDLKELSSTLNVHILETGRVTNWPY